MIEMYENSASESSLYWNSVSRSNRANKDSLVSVKGTGLYRKSIGGFAEIKIGKDAANNTFVLQWDECKKNDKLAAKVERLAKTKTEGRTNTGLYRLIRGKYVEVME